MDGTPEVSRAMLRKVTIRLAHPGARDNYLSLAANANLDPDRIVELAENSFRAFWLTPGRLNGFLREIDDYVAAHRPSGSEIA